MTRDEYIIRDQRYINQSKIKELDSTTICPERYLRSFVIREFAKESDSMRNGQYFEYKLYGTLGRGNTEPPSIPPLKNGNPSTDQKRIDAQVLEFFEVLKKYGIKVIKADFYVEITEDGIILHGTCDNLVEWNGMPCIMDIKLTKDVNSTFGYYAFGHFTKPHPTHPGMFIEEWDKDKIRNYEAVDTVQAHDYMYLMEKKTGKRWGFIYAIFDYKPKPEHKIVEIPYNKEAREDFLRRANNTRDKLRFFKEVDYKAIPSQKACNKCPIVDCKIRFVESSEPERVTIKPVYKQTILPNEEDCPF